MPTQAETDVVKYQITGRAGFECSPLAWATSLVTKTSQNTSWLEKFKRFQQPQGQHLNKVIHQKTCFS